MIKDKIYTKKLDTSYVEDIIKKNFKIPVMAYQVSGEYSLLANGIKSGLFNKEIIIESLIAFKRAGANAIVSYYSDRINDILK